MGKKDKHDCEAYFEQTGGYEFTAGTVQFYGKCELCGKTGHETFVWTETRYDDRGIDK